MATATGSAVNSMGTTLKKGTSIIAGLKSIQGLEVSAESIDVTALDTTGGYKTFIAGAKDAGEIKLQGFFISATFDGMKTDFEAGTKATYTITFPDAGATAPSSWTFEAIVIKLATKANVGNAVDFEATLKVCGQPTFTKAS